MTGQLDSDSTPQRKRIAVACGRCRKRKIRCSGDPGQGQPCSNCKNAGVDQCQFLRVSSREAPLRHDSADFVYSVGDARVYANRTPVTHGVPYPSDVPALGSGDVLASSYRGGSTYPYTAATKAYYPATHAYGTPYPDDFDFGLGVSSSPVMHPETVGMMSGPWGSSTRPKPQPFGSIYLDSPEGAAFGGYGGAGLLHRPSPSASSDSPSFSFSGVATPLPLSTTPGPDRMLPNPAARSSTLPHPGPAKPSTPASASTTTTLVDVATAASYAGGFPTPGLPFCSSGSMSSQLSSSSRSNSDGYSGQESIFSEQERSIQSQGPAFDMAGYTALPRRSSGPGSGAGVSMASHHAYVSGAGAHDAAGTHHHHHQYQRQHSPQNPLPTAYVTEDPPSSPVANRHGQALLSGGDSTSHAVVAHSVDDRHIAVASRQ
ncbi:uncharacterized protein P884DRAFT_280836 [Thermothelomyces heterothallicus CBS 202.75]|uniref:uncharacterized protein n=1 Tax=Thermothelomyces heterothallicus CBS 202.75 TaxID=1149848 RepID=UPI0037441443